MQSRPSRFAPGLTPHPFDALLLTFHVSHFTPSCFRGVELEPRPPEERGPVEARLRRKAEPDRVREGISEHIDMGSG